MRCAKPIDRHNCCCPLSYDNFIIIIQRFNRFGIVLWVRAERTNTGKSITYSFLRDTLSYNQSHTATTTQNDTEQQQQRTRTKSIWCCCCGCFVLNLWFVLSRFSSSIVDGIDWAKMNFNLLRTARIQLNLGNFIRWVHHRWQIRRLDDLFVPVWI